jgi:putative transposase
MGSDPNERAHAYQQWLDAGITPDDLQQLRAYASQEAPLVASASSAWRKPPSDARPCAARVGGHRGQAASKTFN